MTELRAALALEPRHFRGNLLLGRLLALTGKPAEAIPYLQTAVEIDPASAEAKQFLAHARKRKGEVDSRRNRIDSQNKRPLVRRQLGRADRHVASRGQSLRLHDGVTRPDRLESIARPDVRSARQL